MDTKIGSTTSVSRDFRQPPSDVDVKNYSSNGVVPKLGYKIVVGARDNTVYFYKGSGNRSGCNCVGTMPLKKFISIK
jgi:hypothetical protein